MYVLIYLFHNVLCKNETVEAVTAMFNGATVSEPPRISYYHDFTPHCVPLYH